MDNGQFENLRNKLHDVQMPVDADIWQGIESSLRKRRIRRAFLYASSAAAVLIAALLTFIPVHQDLDTDRIIAEHTVLKQNDAMEQLEEAAPVPAEQMLQTIQGNLPHSHKPATAQENSTEGSIARMLEIPEKTEAKADTETGAKDATGTNGAIAADAVQVEADTQPKRETEDAGYGRLTDLENYIAEADTPRKGHSISISSGILPGSSASVTGAMIRATSAGAGNISQSYSVEQISDTKYSLPLNLGLQLQFPIGANMALGIGANYTMLRSRYDCLINKKKFNIKQTLHYIGIPVNIYGLVVEKDNFGFYINAGTAIEKGIRAVYDLKSYDSSEHSSRKIDGMQFSVNAGMGVEYKFSNTVRLYLEPNIVYYINSDIPRSIRTDQPLQVKAEMGFRFRF